MSGMTDSDMGLRLARLERECRLLRGAVSLGALGLLAVVTMGQTAPVPKVVQAETFQVVSPDGKVLGSLGVDDRMRSALKLYADNGKPQVILGADADGGGLLGFVDKGEKLRVALNSDPERGAAFILRGDGERREVALTSSTDASGLNVGDGQATLSLGVKDGNGEFCIGSGAPDKLSASITRFKGGDVCLKLWDKDGKLFHCVPEGAHPEANPK
jgi:hypothetical protein